MEMSKSLKCELQFKTKEVTASQLCEWYKAGLMDDETYKKRLVRIGYAEIDADSIIDACEFSTVPSKAKPAARKAEQERRKIKTRKVINQEKESGNGES
jgi:hypothetical protein